MLFGILMLIIISLVPLQTSPEFIVHEIEACCHHRITLTCDGRSHQQQQQQRRQQQQQQPAKDMRIVVVQARYVIDQEEQIPAVPSSQPLYPFPDPTEKQFQQSGSNGPGVSASDNRPLSNPKTISLWDLDIKWMHDLTKDKIPHPIHVNAPPWHPSHISTFEGKLPFLFHPRRVTTPPMFPDDGLNFTSSRVIEMPQYQMNFLDKNTIWREPLFHVGPTESSIVSSAGGPLQPTAPSRSSSSGGESTAVRKTRNGDKQLPSGANQQTPSSRESRSDGFSSLYNVHYPESPSGSTVGECWSYHALSSTSATFTTDPNRVKPPWHFKDLRAYFNQRCSGKNKCSVELLRGKQPDPDVTKLCHLLPEGKISVKYLCYDANSEYVHSRCNVDVTPAKEGFLHNPGYPDLYPGDQPCQWRLHVPQQKILLVFFDISLRSQEKRICRDELVASEEHSKLLSTCGDHSSAVAVLSESHRLNVTLIPQSRLAFPKRGFLIYYRVLGCRDPAWPANSYMVFRNATHAYLLCDLGHLYPDTLTRDRWLYCNPLEDTWAGTVSHCQDIRGYSSVMGNLSIAQVLLKNPSFWPVRHSRHNKRDNVISDYILPIVVMILLFTVNGFVLFFIWKKRQRLEEMENERNQEMEEICAAAVDGSNTPVDESTFSFPSSAVEDLWQDDHFDDDIDETDQDRTLTTLTLHTTSSPPNSTMMKHYSHNDSAHQDISGSRGHHNGGYYRISQDGSSSGIFSNGGSSGVTGTQHSLFSTYQPQPPPRQSHALSNGSSSYALPNGNGNVPNNPPPSHHHHNSHSAGNGTIIGPGNGSLTGTHSFYIGYTRTTAV